MIISGSVGTKVKSKWESRCFGLLGEIGATGLRNHGEKSKY